MSFRHQRVTLPLFIIFIILIPLKIHFSVPPQGGPSITFDGTALAGEGEEKGKKEKGPRRIRKEEKRIWMIPRDWLRGLFYYFNPCGNGRLDGEERCDDGNRVSWDGCSKNCVIECGIGVRATDEQVASLHCPSACGNGILEIGEGCDDGNAINTDSCVNCQPAACGDSFIQSGEEECDDENDIDTDACLSCRNARCGDGVVQEGVEECDDGNAENGDLCDATCHHAPPCPGFTPEVTIFRVNTVSDLPDVVPGNGTCATSAGTCSLRAAVMESSARPSNGYIVIPEGTYSLTLDTGAPEGDDLNISRDDVVLCGAGAETTFVNGQNTNRIFDIYDSKVIIQGLTLHNGRGSPGGAIFSYGSNLTVTSCILTDNHVYEGRIGYQDSGGALASSWSSVSGVEGNGDVTIEDCTLRNNSAAGEGGAIYQRGGRLNINGTSIYNNLAVRYGGHGDGLYLAPASTGRTLTTTIQNSTFWNDSIFLYSGFYDATNNMIITNSTFDNTPNFVLYGEPISIEIRNSILWGCPFDRFEERNFSASNSLGTSCAASPALLGPFEDDGTPGGGYLPLLSESPAVDAGNTAFCTPSDQLGNPRVGPCDIGAIEYQP